MKTHISAALVALWISYAGAQDAPPAPSAATPAAPNEKALKYYDALVKRPAAGYLFDRFYNAWLDAQTIEDLEKFLREKAAETTATTGQRLVLAFFYAKQNEHVKALEQFRVALEKDPGNADAWFQKANAEARTLDFDSALKDLAKALESKPNAEMSRQIKQLQGKLLARNAKNEEAMKVWKELLAENPSDEDLQEDLIELQISEGLNAEALSTAETLLAATKDPYKKVQRRLRVGDIQSRLGNRDKAVEVYSAALDEVGTDSWLEKETLAQIEQTFRRDDALEDLKKHYAALVSKYPQRLTLRRAQAKLLAETGNAEGAVKVFQEILQVTPGDREVREAYVQLLAESKKLDEAVMQLRELIKLHPEDGELLIKLADLFAQAEKKEDCQKILEEFLTKSDGSEQTHLRVAGLLERSKLEAASLALFKSTAEKFPDSEAARENYAVALHKAGQKDEARAAWKKMAESPDKVRVMNVARSAAARDEGALAYDLLSARLAEFGGDSLFLSQYCEAAQKVEKYTEALPWARKLVALAQGAIELDTALTTAWRIAERAEKTDDVIKELQTAALTVQDKCLLAELLERRGSSKEAEALLQQVTSQDAELGTALLVRLQTTRGDYVAAAQTLRKLVEAPGGRKSVHVQRLVDLYERAGQLDQALAWIPEWKKATPGSTQAWLKEADLMASVGKVKEALNSLRLASQQFEGNEDVRAQLGAAFRAEGKLADAERVFMQLFEEAKDTGAKVRWAGELASTAEMSGKSQELVEAFEERRRNNRTAIVPLLALAEIHRVTNNYEGRRKALLEAARIKRDDLDLLLEIARIEQSEGEFDHALQTLRDALPLDKTGEKVKNRMAKALFAAGRDEEGMKLLYDLAGGEKMDARSAESLADSLIGQENWKEAAAFLAPILKRFPKDYRLTYQYAVSLEESEQTKPALEQFQKLMVAKEEVPVQPSAAGAINQNWWTNDWWDSVKETLPAEGVEMLQLMQYSYSAYQYKQRRNSYGSYSPAGGPVVFLSIPPKVEEVRRFAFPHLASLAKDLSDQERDALKRDLRSVGIGAASLLDLMGNGRLNMNNPDFAELLEKNPEDESLMSLAAFYSMNNNQAEPKFILRIFDHFKTKRPALAIGAVLPYRSTEDPALTKAFSEAVDMLEKMEKPNVILVNVVSQVFNAQRQESPEAALDDESKKEDALLTRLRQKLLSWMHAGDQSSPYLSNVLNVVLWDLLRQDKAEEIIRLLEDELQRHAAQSGKTAGVGSRYNQYYYSRYSSGRQAPLAPLSFPPAELPNFSPMVLSILSTDENNNYYGNQRWTPDPEKLKPLLPSVKDPILKLLLTNLADDDDAVTKLLVEMTAGKEPTLPSLMLGSAWAANQEKWDEAVATMKKAEYLPLTKEQRRLVDSSILSWALQRLESSSKEGSEVAVAAGREAALRLRRDTLGPEQKQQLAEAMERLELKQEAERMLASLASSGTNASASGLGSLMGGGSSTRVSPKSRIDTLLQQGKTDAAVQILAKELKSLSKSWLVNRDESKRYQAKEWLQPATANGLVESLSKAVAPPAESKDALALAQGAAAMEILGKKPEAKALYQRAIELKPKDENILISRLLFAIQENPQEAIESLQDIQPAALTQAAQSLAAVMDNVDSNQRRIDIAKIVERYLASLKPDVKNVDLSWAEGFLDQLAQYGYERRGDSLPNLYSIDAETQLHEGEEEENQKRTEAQKRKLEERRKLQEERRSIHQKICQAGLAVPQLARHCFLRLAGMQVAAGKTAQDLAELAKQAILTEASSKSTLNPNSYANYYDDGTEQIRFFTPEEILLEHAFAAKNEKLITDELLPQLRASKAQNAAKTLEADTKLFFCEPAEFFAVASEYVKRRTVAMRNPAEEGLIWNGVFRALELRGLELDFTAPLVASLKKNAYTSWGGAEMAHVSSWAKHLAAKKGGSAVREFLDQVAEVYLGPKDKRQEFLKKNYNPRRGYSSQTPAAGIQKWLSFHRSLGDTPAVAFAMLASYDENFTAFAPDLPGQDSNIYFDSSRLLRKAKYGKDLPELMALLRHAPFLADMKEFRTLPLDRQRSPVLGEIIERLRNSGDEQRGKMREALAKESSTFGSQVIQAGLEDLPWNALLKLLGQKLEELKALPEVRQVEIASLVSWAKQRTGKAQSSLTEPEAAAREWAEHLKGTSGGKEVDNFLAAKSLNAIGMSEYELHNLLERVMPDLLRENVDMAGKVLQKSRDLALDYRRTNRNNHSSFGDNASVIGYSVGRILSEVRNRQDPTVDERFIFDSINVIGEALLSKKGLPVEVGQNTVNEIEQLLQLVGTVKESNRPRFDPQKYIKVVGSRLKPELGWLYFSAATQPLWNAPQAYHKAKGGEIRTWIEQQAISTEPHAWFAKLAMMGLNMAERRDSRIDKAEKERKAAEAEARKSNPLAVVAAKPIWDGITDPAKLPAEQKLAYDAMGSDQQPLLCRIAIAHGFLDDAKESAEPALRLAAGKLLAEAWQSGLNLPSQDASRIIRRLSNWGVTLSDSVPEEFKVQGSAIIAGWKKAVQSNRGQTPAAQSILELAVALNDSPTINQVVSSAGGLANRFWLGKLVAGRHFEAANRLLAASRESLFVEATSENLDVASPQSWQFNGTLAKALPDFLASVEGVPNRYAAEVLLNSLPDTVTVKAAGLPPQVERLKAVATRYPSGELTNLDLAERLLQFLAKDEAVIAAVGENTVKAIVERQPMASVLDIEDYAIRQRKTSLHLSWLKSRIKAGDLSYLTKSLPEIVHRETDDDYQRSQLAGQVWMLGVQETLAMWPKFSANIRTANRQFWTEMLLTEDAMSGINQGQFFEHQQLLHVLLLTAMEDKISEFDAAFAKAPEDWRGHLSEIARSLPLSQTMAQLRAFPWPEDARAQIKEKSRLLLKVAEAKTTGLLGQNVLSPWWFRNMSEINLVRIEDVLKDGDKWVSLYPQHGLRAAEFAHLALRAKRPDEALQWLQRSAQEPPAAQDITEHIWTAILRAEAYYDLKKFAEAKRALEVVTPEQLAKKDLRDNVQLNYGRLVSSVDQEILLASGSSESVLQQVTARLNAAPTDLFAWEAMAQAMEKIGVRMRKDSKNADAASYFAASAVVWRAVAEKKRSSASTYAQRIASMHLDALRDSGDPAMGKRMISPGSSWRYAADRQAVTGEWKNPEFDASQWPEGKGPLGFGDDDLATIILNESVERKQIMSACFRMNFAVDEVSSIKTATLSLRRDDGAVIYLNGHEVGRSNMPKQDISPETKASTSVSGDAERQYVPIKIAPDAFRQGQNVLAVEVHQDRASSSDISFDAELWFNAKSTENLLKELKADSLKTILGSAWDSLPAAFRETVEKP